VSNKIPVPSDFLEPKIKLSPYRPLGFQAVEAPTISRHQHMTVAWLSALHTSCLFPRRHPWYSFLLEAELAWGPLCGWKDPPPSEIEPATFQLLAVLQATAPPSTPFF
jgi:hypothetical protein